MIVQARANCQHKIIQKAHQAVPVQRESVSRLATTQAVALQRATHDPRLLTTFDVSAFQSTVGNRPPTDLLQAQLAVSAANNHYEQETNQTGTGTGELTPELKAQKPTGKAVTAEQKRIAPASGHLFCKTWFSQQFKSKSSFIFKNRPAELKAIDKAPLVYEQAQITRNTSNPSLV